MTTFVLVPGAGGDAWYWHRVVPLLTAAGHEAVALDLPADDPASGLPEYARIVSNAVGSSPDVILVAQSLGGFPAAQVAATGEHPGLRAIVFVNAMIPEPGETAGDWWEHVGQESAMRSAAEAGGWTTDFEVEAYFLHDVPPEVLASGAGQEKPQTDTVFAVPCDFTAWPPITTRVVAGRDDRFFPVTFQQSVARKRLGVEPDVLPGGHLIALSRPWELADYLVAI
ncbi:MAG: alpha/beta hydrolase [Intrasporangium sp.]|uniref:alpha/beta fold hydrolase n=1 Tax=Intrasporangium sp. TaxID=1925024 RepID=UPI0026482139|nr:alpha/beta hydrolase [Intrasporangium sp.]MDN5794402.1 alpha/beta hydrolase [Intrasporangium sp.]